MDDASRESAQICNETPNLYDQWLLTWNWDLIRQLMGSKQVLHIRNGANTPTRGGSILKDRLIWKHSTSGQHTAKEGYLILRQQSTRPPAYTLAMKELWARIWSWKTIIPRIQVFLWQAKHEGLPTLMALRKRINKMNLKCSRCGTENEFTMHMLFFCQVSRATWFMSKFNLRVELLPLDFTEGCFRSHLT